MDFKIRSGPGIGHVRLRCTLHVRARVPSSSGCYTHASSSLNIFLVLAMPPRHVQSLVHIVAADLAAFLVLVTFLTSMAFAASGKRFVPRLAPPLALRPPEKSPPMSRCAGPDASNQDSRPLQHHPRPSMATSSRYYATLPRLPSPAIQIAPALSTSRSVGTTSLRLVT